MDPDADDADVVEARGPGRPSKFRPEFIEQAEKLCILGATDIELADFFKVDVRTIYRWKAENEAFCQALKAGKEAADERVERSLYAKATGYTHDAVKIMQHNGEPVVVPYREHVPPDTAAAIFWLKNRRPQAWREKVEIAGGLSISRAVTLTDDALADIAAGSGAGAAAKAAGAPESPALH